MAESTLENPGQQDLNTANALVRAFLTNEHINQILLNMIPPDKWRKNPPASPRRNIATTFAHIHNVRRMRLVMSDKSVSPPAKINRATVTPDQARRALTESAECFSKMIAHLAPTKEKIKNYRADMVLLVCAAVNHEAHHRGQICLWARELGFPLSGTDQLLLWEWDKHWQKLFNS